MSINCQYCFKVCRNKSGLTQHIRNTKYCSEKQREKLLEDGVGYKTAEKYLPFTTIVVPRKRAKCSLEGADEGAAYDVCSSPEVEIEGKQPADSCIPTYKYGSDGDEYLDAIDVEFGGVGYEDETSLDNVSTNACIKSIKDDFLKYVQVANKSFGVFSSSYETAIKLLHKLRKSSASLGMYEEIMDWHFDVLRRKQIGSRPLITREKLLKKLKKRYNMVHNTNIIYNITLPSSCANAKIVTNCTKWCIQSLLTDPSIKDEDYLFHENNPLSEPPHDLDYVEDINTGAAYFESYKKYVKIPGKQVLLPVIFYIDGAATAQFSDLPITAVKFTFGIFNRKARNKPEMWRTLGYIPAVSKEKSRGKRQFLESGHVDSANPTSKLIGTEGNLDLSSAVPAQDLHTILSKILEDFILIQEEGFEWDLMYGGKEYKGIQFIPYVHFIKCDTEEADRLAGKYTSRGINVSQLCRYCCCPTTESDDPRANYEKKTVPMIRKLVLDGDVEGLKLLSQHPINNVWYGLRFGAHSNEGVHGSCPLEMLHALLLGIFKYVRDCFFEQIGEKSKVAGEINALAVKYGELYCRQSDRNMPKTTFNNGIKQGKLMAKEYPGVLLIMTTILVSTKGSGLLKSSKQSVFGGNEGLIEDWISMLETLLMWESWLKSDRIYRKHVRRAQEKHRFIMHMILNTADRQSGMGLKITKFHAIVHMADDIINFGVPMNYDTGSDESGHKPAKTAAKVTQKRKELFDEQVGNRLTEVQALDLAMMEIIDGKVPWKYYSSGRNTYENETKEVKNTYPFGGRYKIICDETGNKTIQKMNKDSTKGGREVTIERSYVDFLVDLSDGVLECIPDLEIRTTIWHNDVLFRGSPRYMGAPWRDWVIIDWGDDGFLPAKIWGFVNLETLPENNAILCGGLRGIPPGIYAIVESAEQDRSSSSDLVSELFIPIIKEVGGMQHNRVTKLKFYLADVDAFYEPVVVIPDVGGLPNRYLMLKNVRKWKEDFTTWLETPYEKF